MMRIKYLLAILALCIPSFSSNAAVGFAVNIRDLGANPDGKTFCTEAIQKAVDQCNQAGGGTVYFPPGTWLSGTIFMKSNVTLYLETGATLLGSGDPKDYPEYTVKVRSLTETYSNKSLLVGEDLDNIAIRGRGTINGQGEKFNWKRYTNRPWLIRFVNCRDVLLEDVFLCNSGMWMQHYLECDRLTLRGVRVRNHATYNNDGLDIDGCHDVVVTGCFIDADDDALCLKSNSPRSNENITITNCVLSSHCNALKMGTESTGGLKNLTVSNCTIVSPRTSKVIYGHQRGISGISLEIVDGGTLENVTISNITIDGVSNPIFLRLGDRARPHIKDAPRPPVGTFRNVTLSNIIATNVSNTGCTITGIPNHRIENVTLSNIRIEFPGGGTKEHAEREIEEHAARYPESTMFGMLPAYGFYCRHVKGLRMNNVQLVTKEPDARPALKFEDAEDVLVDGIDPQAATR